MANKKLEVNVQHIIKDIEAGKFTSFQSILNETGGQHIYEAVNEELRKYLKENNAVMISATQLAHLRETGYKDFESERKALESQLKTATGELKKQIEGKLKDLNKFQYYSERKAPIGDELHKILELTDKGLVDLNDAVKAANQIMQQMQVDPQTSEKLKSLVGKTSADTMKNFRRAIKNAQDFQKMKISAGMVGGETETARSMAFKKDGKLYVVSGSTDWTKAKEGKIGDYKTTASFSAMHNLIQSVVNATLIRAQEGENLPITSKVAHLPITAGRMKYANTLPGVYDINVGSYQEGVKLISDLVDVLEGKKDFTSVRIPGSVQGRVEKGQFVHKDEIKEATYYNGKPIGQWVGQTVEEVKSLLDSLAPQQRQQFLGTLFGQTDGKPWYNTENAKILKEAFKGLYQPIERQYKTYGGMSLGALSGKFVSGEVSRDDVINAIKEGVKTQIDTEDLASRLFFGEEKYYSKAFVDAIRDAIPDISAKMEEIFNRELDKDMPGYLSGLSDEEKPQPSKYEMYQPDVWELEEKRQQAWIESGIERRKLGYTDKPLFDDKGVKTLADRMTRLVDFYQRVNNIFDKVAGDINKDLPEGTASYTGEELARTYLARKTPEVYDRYMRSKGLYEKFTSDAQGLFLEDQVKWIREQLDTFIAEEGNLLNTFDTFNEIADEQSRQIFSKEFARKIGYVGKPGDYVAPGTLYGLLTGSTFGVAQEYQMSEFDKDRGRDIYGRTLSPEAVDTLKETQIDDDISKIDFYKQRLSEMTEELGVSADKMKIFTDYLDRMQKVADQAGIELDQVFEGVDEKGFIKQGSLLDKQLRALGEMPVETDLYLPRGKKGLTTSERTTLMGLLDETGIDNLTTQYEIYLNEQDSKRKEEIEKQEEIRLEKEREFTKLVDSELENRLKFLYAETQKPEYLKRQEAAERGEDLGLTEEMFKGFSGKSQKGLSIGEVEPKAEQVVQENITQTEAVNDANQKLAEVINEEVAIKNQEIIDKKSNGDIQDVRKRGKVDAEYDKWIVDRVVKNELGEVTDTIYKRARKSSGTRGPSGISQVVDRVIPAVESIDQNIKEINEKIPSSFKSIDWDSFQNAFNKTGVSLDDGAVSVGGSGGKGGGKKSKADEEKAAREYQQYLNQRFSLLSKIEAAQSKYNISMGKQKVAAAGVVEAGNIELKYLDERNKALVDSMEKHQNERKAQMDYQQELKIATMRQQKLLGTQGAESLWDVMANDIQRAAFRITDFGIAAKVLNKIPQDIQKVIQYTKELDAAMTNVRIVTGASQEEAKSLAKQYTQLAKELGSTTVEIANSANEWARQGYTAEEANDLIVQSTKLAKLGMISSTEATKDLTSAMKGFKLSVEEASDVVDKLTKLDQVSAISAGNLAEGLSRVANTAQEAGLSLDETAAMVSTITEVTQRDASTAGEALRTLISRYSNVKAGVFTSMSDSAEDTSENINDVEKVLSKLGIRIRNSSSEIRNVGDVLDELAEKWDTLDDVSRNAVATAFAGVRQRESFNILLSNWDRVKELTEESANAAGTADEKYTAYMDSMEAATKRLQNAWESFTQTLETSTVMKALTNATAAVVENFDKFKYLITLLGALSASKVVDAIANPGEIGGFKGLIANIPFIGTGTKTNNLLESLDKNVKKMKDNQEQEMKTDQKQEKSRASWLKKGFGREDIYDPETGRSISYKAVSLYEKQAAGKIRLQESRDWMRYTSNLSDEDKKLLAAVSDGDKEALAELEKARETLQKNRTKSGALGAATTLIAGLSTDKNIDDNFISQFIKQGSGVDEDITMQETSEGKAWRIGNSTIAAGIMGYFLGPIGAQIGAALGDGFASITSTLFHLSDLQRKQRVKEAKEQLKILDGIKSATEDGNEIMSEKFLDTSGYDKLNKYVDNLTAELNKLDPSVISDILEAVRETGKTNATTTTKLGEDILNSDSDTRKQIQRALDISLAEQQYGKLVGSTEDQSILGFDISAVLSSSLELKSKVREIAGSVDIDKGTLEERLETATRVYTELQKSELDKTFYSKTFKTLQEYIEYLKELNETNKQLRESQIQIAYLKSDISDLTDQELSELTMDGVVYRVVESLENMGVAVRDLSGDIKTEYLTQIKSMIKANSDLAVLTQNDTKTIGELETAWSDFVKVFGGGVEIYEHAAEALRKGKFKEFLDELGIQGDADALEKLVYAANPERIEQFASAWNMTTEAAKEFAKVMPNLTTALGLMSTTEIADKMSKIASIFSDLSENGKLTVENFNAILKNYPEYINQLSDYEGLLGSLGKTLTEESLAAYKNALFTALMSDENYYKKFKEGLSDEFSALLTGTNVKTLTDVLNLAQTNSDFAALNDELSKFLNQTYELEIDNPLRDLAIEAKEGLLDKQITNLNDQKEALSQINDERKKELEYIKAKIALEDAQKEKKRVYVQGVGWTYVADDATISEAKEKLDSLDIERQQNAIQLQIDSLEQQKEILDAIKNNEQLEKIEEALGKNGISTNVEDIAKMMSSIEFNPTAGQLQMYSKKQMGERNEALTEVDKAWGAYKEYVDSFKDRYDRNTFSTLEPSIQKKERGKIDSLYKAYTEAYAKASGLGADVSDYSTNGRVKEDELADYQLQSLLFYNTGKGLFDWGNDDVWIQVGNKIYRLETTDRADIVTYDQSELTAAYGSVPSKGDFLSYKGKYYAYNGNSWWAVLRDRRDGADFYNYMADQGFANGTLSAKGGRSLINELGTEAIITPSGTITALPTKTGVVPADITKNLWSLGEVAPTLVAQLSSLNQKTTTGAIGNTTYEEGQYFDNFTMNVYPAKGDDFNKILEQARAQMRLTRHNN